MREIWITEAGVVTAAGNNLEATWEQLMAGRTAIRKIDRFPVQAYQSEIGAFIPDLKYSGTGSLLREIMDLLLSQIDKVPADSLLITASTKAGIDNLEKIKQGVAADPEDMLPASITKWVAARSGSEGLFISHQCRLCLFHRGRGPGGVAHFLRGCGIGPDLLPGSNYRIRLFRIFGLSNPVAYSQPTL